MKKASTPLIPIRDLPTVVFEWEDAFHTPEDVDFEDAAHPEPCLRRSSGFLVKATKRHVIIASTLDQLPGGVGVTDTTTVPRSLIRGPIKTLVEEPHGEDQPKP